MLSKEFSAEGFSPCIMCVQYIGGCSVHRGVFSTSGGYHEYIGGVQYIGGIPWVHRGDIMSTSGDVQYIGGISWYMWGSNLIKSFQFLLKTPMYWTSPDVLNIPRCTHDIPPMYSWYPPDVLMVSPRCTHGIPPMYWTPPDVLNIPRCTEHTLYRVIFHYHFSWQVDFAPFTSIHSFCGCRAGTRNYEGNWSLIKK